MTKVELRLPLGLGHRLHQTVFARGEHEYVGFCLVSHVEVNGVLVLLVREVKTLEEREYLDNAAHGASWRGTSMLPVVDEAMRRDLGVVLVHSHASGRPPRLSTDDLHSAARLIPFFQRRVPDAFTAHWCCRPEQPAA